MAYDKRNLAAGIQEMRSVAKRLVDWANDLETMLEKDAPPEGSVAEEFFTDHLPAAGEAGVGEEDKPVTRSEVKAFLTSLCAKGFSSQVKALIASFDASALSGVPDEDLGAV